jgi:hypothetical protein
VPATRKATFFEMAGMVGALAKYCYKAGLSATDLNKEAKDNDALVVAF